MISILHLSDLHIVKSARWNNLKHCILEEAGSVHDRPSEEKLLLLTGDFKNFSDEDYSAAKLFLQELFQAMNIDPSMDVFAVPGNHDVANSSQMDRLFGKDSGWGLRQESSVNWLKTHNSSERRYLDYIRWRMESYRPFCQFLLEIGIPVIDDFAATPYVRCWRNKINLLHLNTTLVADGTVKDQQRVDLLTATSDKIWEGFSNTLPTIALGHNSFFDLDESHQTALEAVFLRKNVCAYLCGDTHKEELNRKKQIIRLRSGYSVVPEIPNIVCVKGASDDSDDYSDFGLYWHEWNNTQGKVNLRLLSWKPNVDQSGLTSGRTDLYYMPRMDHNYITNTPKSEYHENIKKVLEVVLDDVRKNHPSFKLMGKEGIDIGLYPKARVVDPFATFQSDTNYENETVWTIITSRKIP